MADIVDLCKAGIRKTHIMYKAKLSYSQINTYLQLLVDKGFLENNKIVRKRQTITMYRTTPKGVHFIENIDNVNELLE